jgi:hypothetical protein
MNTARRALVAVLILILLPSLASASAGPQANEDCGAISAPPCWSYTLACRVAFNETRESCLAGPRPSITADGACRNYGIVSQATVLGENRYCVGRECENQGVVVLLGRTRSCHGSGYGVVCVEDSCTILLPLNFAMAGAAEKVNRGVAPTGKGLP